MKIPINTIIISDIHLGSEVSRAEKTTEMLFQYEFKKLILLGDIFDDLNFKRLNKEHWKFLSYIRKLSKNVEVIWIFGNHDELLINIMNHLLGSQVYEEYIWTINNKNFLAIHGHQFDKFMKNNIFISNIATYIYHILQKLDKKTQKFSRWIKRMSKSWLRLSKEVAIKSMQYAIEKKKNINYVFCGHTHQAMI
jgi:UDP-2,3-diacylglucosamine pyrophosphatase LpxH